MSARWPACVGGTRDLVQILIVIPPPPQPLSLYLSPLRKSRSQIIRMIQFHGFARAHTSHVPTKTHMLPHLDHGAGSVDMMCSFFSPRRSWIELCAMYMLKEKRRKIAYSIVIPESLSKKNVKSYPAKDENNTITLLLRTLIFFCRGQAARGYW